MPSAARLQHQSAFVIDLKQRTGYYTGFVSDTILNDMNYYEILSQDAEIKRCLHQLAIQTAGKDVVVEIKNNFAVERLINSMLQNIRYYVTFRKSLVEKSVLYGIGIQRKHYKNLYLCGLKQPFRAPYYISEVDNKRVRIESVRKKSGRMERYWTMWLPKNDRYMILEDRFKVPSAREGTALQDYMFHIFEQEEREPYGAGLGRILYVLAYIKRKVLEFWVELCESWARPFVIALIDTLKASIDLQSGGTGMETLETRIEEIIKAVEKSRKSSHRTMVVDKADTLDMHEMGSIGNNIIRELINYCDEKIALLILGSYLATASGKNGSYAMAVIHLKQSRKLILYNRARLIESIKQDIVFDFIYRNREIFYKNGLSIPRFNDVEVCITDFDTSENEDTILRKGSM